MTFFGRSGYFWTSSVDVDTLGCLWGKDIAEALGLEVSFLHHTMSCPSARIHHQKLGELPAGHYRISLQEGKWQEPTKTFGSDVVQLEKLDSPRSSVAQRSLVVSNEELLDDLAAFDPDESDDPGA